jgi:lipoprotein-anchoring transpeptidase ErfK/SrfK
MRTQRQPKRSTVFRRQAILVIAIAACAKDPAAVVADADLADVELDVQSDTRDPDAEAWAERAHKLGDARDQLDAGHWTGAQLYAAAVRTSVMSAPEWPPDAPPDGGVAPPAPSGVHRLGYLRHGSHAPVFDARIKNDDCPDGWFELLEGGFVCGKYASLDPKDPAVKWAASAPKLDQPMPYSYGYATGNNTPVYRRVLAMADRLKYEPWLLPPVAPSASASALLPPPSALVDEDNPYDDDPKVKAGKDAGAKDAGIIKLDSLKGRGVLARKMMRGFYVALDHDFTAAKAHWWRTAEGFAIPYERMAMPGWSPGFHGGWITRAPEEDGGEVAAGSGTAALVRTEFAAHYRVNEKGKVVWTTPLAKWTALELSGDPITSDGVQFQRTTSGFVVRLADLRIAKVEKPDGLLPNEKWIDVDLEHQVLIAYEGDRPVFGTLVSSGKNQPWDPEHAHPTPTGTYRIYEKHISATMDGDVATDGPYSIEDVPWVMFFQGSYALHGAFWHDLFGTPRSHGCVNLSPIDARELFFWTEPRLPTGWHGVFQTGDRLGTRLVIHDASIAQTPKKAN